MTTAEYEAVIGLEVHVELKTRSKAFCHCATSFGVEPNTHVCPICLGMPGVLPVLNREMVEYALMTALALNCRIAGYCKFDRKNYFYPDLPKNYQISQYDLPIATGGSLVIETENGPRTIGINRVHMEEDTGKLVHKGSIMTTPYSLVDLNRAGTPLLEIVSEPDLRSPGEARMYVEKLRLILLYLGVSDGKMEEGSLRCDANISVRPPGQQKLGTRTEIKNLNSFRALERALDYEIRRQIKTLAKGERIIQETRTWDEHEQVTMSMRSKEEAHDYRYFPDPDLPPLRIDPAWVERVCRSLPELPDQARRRLSEEYNLRRYDALLLTASRDILDFFDDCVAQYPKPKVLAKWITGDLARLLNRNKLEIKESKITPASLVGLLRLLEEGTISGTIAKAVLAEMFTTGESPDKIVRERGLTQISDEQEVRALVGDVIAENSRAVAEFQKWKDRALRFLMGQAMKASGGKANPELVYRLLREELSGR